MERLAAWNPPARGEHDHDAGGADVLPEYGPKLAAEAGGSNAQLRTGAALHQAKDFRDVRERGVPRKSWKLWHSGVCAGQRSLFWQRPPSAFAGRMRVFGGHHSGAELLLFRGPPSGAGRPV